MVALEHTNDVTNAQILKALSAEQHGDNRYRGLCPSHDDKNPSLDIYLNAEGYLGFNCLSKRCKSFEIINAIRDKFGLTVPVRRSGAGGGDRQVSSRVLYPAHESVFPFQFRKPDDILYEYTTATGEVAFFVQRYYSDDGKKQTPAWFSYEHISDGGRVSKLWGCKDPPKKNRPIYNLHLLEHYPTRPVLVVEGEKTAEAAQVLPFFKDYVVTTWSGGGKQVRASDWSILKTRNSDIILWPDHDGEGVKAMKDVAATLGTGPMDQRISMIDYSILIEDKIEKGWDLADGCANQECDYSFEDLWSCLRPYHPDEMVASAGMEQALAERDKRYRKLYIGGQTYVIDLSIKSDDSPFGVRWFKDITALMSVDVERAEVEVGDRLKVLNVAREWYDTRGTGTSLLAGVRFDPTSTNLEIKYGGQTYLNSFQGFPAIKTKEKTNALVDAWLTHLDGMVVEKQAKEWIADYFADIFQNPGRKPGTALALLGGQGVGKSLLIHCVAKLLGNSLCRLINKDIMKNNSALSRSLLVVHDEWSINHFREKPYYEALKNAISNTRLRIEEKYLPPWDTDSFCRFAFTSNDSKPIKLPPDDRRFTIVYCQRKWFENREHFGNIIRLLDNENALGGFRDYLSIRKITSDLLRSYNTAQKEELWETDNRALNEVIQWADGNGLPGYFHEVLGHEMRDFGDKPLLIPRSTMREFFIRNIGASAYSNADVTMLKRLFIGPEFKRRVPVFDRRGGEGKLFELCFEIPKLPELRQRIEVELNKNYPWNDAEIRFEPGDEVDDTNVVPLKRGGKDTVL